MPNLTSNERRRRLRLIKTIEAQTAIQFKSAVSALAIATDTESTRLDADAVRQKLLVECRAMTSTVLRVEHPGAAPMDVAMNRPYLLIGSDPACDICLEHDEIKPRHCFLQWLDGHLYFVDLRPRTGYFPVDDAQAICFRLNDEPIPVGPYQLRLMGIESESSAELPVELQPLDRSARLASEFPYLAMQFSAVEQAENVWPVNRTLTMIGRGSQCKLRLNHKSMAYVQAVLIRTSTGCWIVDLARDEKTCVNGRPIQVSPIDVGDELQLGAFLIDVVTLPTPSHVPVSISAPQFAKPEMGADKPLPVPLPPIRFDRQPKSFSREPAAASPALLDRNTIEQPQTAIVVAQLDTESTGRAVAAEAGKTCDILERLDQASNDLASELQASFPRSDRIIAAVPELQPVAAEIIVDPTQRLIMESESVRELAAVETQFAFTEPQRQTSSKRRRAEVAELIGDSNEFATEIISHVRIARRAPNRGPGNSAVSRPEVALRAESPSDILQKSLVKNGADEKIEQHQTPSRIGHDRQTTSDPSQPEEPVVTEKTMTDGISDSTKASIGTTSPSVVEFLKQQQSELAGLKKQLDELKRIYDAAAGQLISKKTRDALEKPVLETMQCHDSMHQKLVDFMQKLEPGTDV